MSGRRVLGKVKAPEVLALRVSQGKHRKQRPWYDPSSVIHALFHRERNKRVRRTTVVWAAMRIAA